MSIECQSCHKPISADDGGRLPPWCPHCGGDLKKKATPAAVTLTAVQADGITKSDSPPPAPSPAVANEPAPAVLRWLEPEAMMCPGEYALDAAMGRATAPKREKQLRRHKNRMGGLLAIAAGVLAIGVIVGANHFLNTSTDGHFQIVVPMKLTGLGVILIVGGVIALVSGRDTLAMTKQRDVREVVVGPDGISRAAEKEASPGAPGGALFVGWEQISGLVYVEDPLLPGQAMLEVRTRGGNAEHLRIPPEVTPDQLSAVARAHGRMLEVKTWDN